MPAVGLTPLDRWRSLVPPLRPRPKLAAVMFFVAVAVRKFQKFAADKFKESITYYFDRQAALEELKRLHQEDQTFFIKEFVKLAYFVRKFRLTFDDLGFLDGLLGSIYDCIKQGLNGQAITESQKKMLHFLCLTLKHLTRNAGIDEGKASCPLGVASIVDLIRTGSKSRAINNALVMMLAHRLNLEISTAMSSNETSALEVLVLELTELDPDVRAFFFSKLEGKKARKEDANADEKTSMRVRKVRKNQQVVSKTIQTVRSKQEKKQSEETDMTLLDLTDCARNRNRKINNLMENVPLAEGDGGGSDQSIWNNTWSEVINLFSLVSQGKALKKDDKDNYLPDKLLGNHYYPATSWNSWPKGPQAVIRVKRLYSFLINRMCASALEKVSRRQQLNDRAIDKLLECVADFDSIASRLRLNRDELVDAVVDGTLEGYWELKELASPDVAVDFVKKVMGEATEEYQVSWGWFGKQTKVRKRSYDHSELEKIVCAEVNQVRVDAIKALYNCAVRDKKTVLTKQRVDRITAYIMTAGKEGSSSSHKSSAKFEKVVFELMEVANTLDDFDYRTAFANYFARLPSECGGSHAKSILAFIRSQARDEKRSRELFTQDVMETLIGLLDPESDLNKDGRLELLGIINTCLQHEVTEALSEGNLAALLDIAFRPGDEDGLLSPGLTSLLLSTDKTRSVSPLVLDELAAIADDEDECTTSYIVFILSRVYCSRDFIADAGLVEAISGKMLCNHVTHLNDDDDQGQPVLFKEASKQTDDSSGRISLLAAKIVEKSVEAEVAVTSATVGNLLLALEGSSGDKQTKISAAKCLCGLAKHTTIETPLLNQLLGLLDSPVYDVGVYLQAAYLAACAKVARTPSVCLDSVHLEGISGCYAPESLVLAQHDYEPEINESLFETLLHESAKQELTADENLFPLFNGILGLSGKHVPWVMRILVSYTFRYGVPDDTVRILENMLGIADYFEEALTALQNVVLGGRSSVTSKTLSVFTDHLWQSTENSHLRVYSFKLLERASQNQELSERIFSRLEMVRAGYALERSQLSTDRRKILEFVLVATDAGMQLPVDTDRALRRDIGSMDVLKIFANASRNKQIVAQDLLDAFVRLFDPENNGSTDVNVVLIDIFLNAAKNNQALSAKLQEKLERALNANALEDSVLLVFNYLAQKGEKLPVNVNNKLLDRLLTERDPVLIQDRLSTLGSLIDANRADIGVYLPKVKQILTRELGSDNGNVQKLCIVAIQKLVTVSKTMDETLLERLVEACTDPASSKTVRDGIHVLFESIEDKHNPSVREKHYREKMKLASLKDGGRGDLLGQLRRHADLGGEFLAENYGQLRHMLNKRNAGMQEDVLKILLSYRHKSKLTDPLLDGVAILCDSTTSDRLREIGLQLLRESMDSGKALVGRARNVLDELGTAAADVQAEWLRSKVCKKIKQDLGLSDQDLAGLAQLVGRKASGLEHLKDLLSLVVEQRAEEYYLNKSFVLLLEQCLLKEKAPLASMLPCYCRIIKEGKGSRTGDCLEMLAQHLIEAGEQCEESVEATAFDCMYQASKHGKVLPDVCMALAVESLDHEKSVIRGNAFNILRGSKDERFKGIRDKWGALMLTSLAETAGIKIPEKCKGYTKLDLLEIVVSVDFLDVNVFTNNKETEWMRELLCSSMFEKIGALKMEQIHFYTGWFEIEKKFGYIKSCKLLLQAHNSKFDHFSEVLDLIAVMAELQSFDEVSRMMNAHGPEPHKAFKQDWCKKKISQACLGDISANYVHRLAGKLSSSFNVTFIGKLLGCLKSIDNLSAFEELLDFCSREKIDLNDVIPDKTCLDLDTLVRLVETRYLISRCVACRPENEVEEKRFMQIVETLSDCGGWSFAQLRDIVTAFRPEGFQGNRFCNLLHFLHTVQVYGLYSPSNFEKSKRILNEGSGFHTMMRKLNSLAVENHFQLEGKVKDPNELVAELRRSNTQDRALTEFIDRGGLDIRKHIFEEQADKLTWREKRILVWAIEVRSGRETFTDYEGVAVALQANRLITGYTLTGTQILSCLVALRTGEKNIKSNGKLLEVATGEGKSTIVCVLAIINALRGYSVDVITSSPVLAERDAKDKAKLYRYFGLTCSDNNDKTVYLSGKKSCYDAHVVYGEMSQFQFDILRDSYSQLGTLGGRKFAVAIIDEVDSMLIDDSSKIARLSSTVSGMDHFRTIYVLIWQRLLSIKERFVMFRGKLYFVNGRVGFENGRLTLEVVDGGGATGKIQDLEAYVVALEGKDDAYGFVECVGEDVDEYLRTSLKHYLDKQIAANKIYIPSNFVDFQRKQTPKWIMNAVEALNHQENVHYVVQCGEIRPVDYHSTGIVQASTSWSDGLHQFLQLKHNLRMTSETITTNFLSNMGLMKKYKQVYGLTGTLGSETARTVLRQVYQVDLINIPQRRQKQYLELESVVAEGGETAWLEMVTATIVRELDKDRGVLVICETIENTSRIGGKLKERLAPNAVKLYAMNDMDQEKNVEKIAPGQVIVATNLAGRGTDIKTDEIEATGGLHVILTFMPGNQRVEDQAFGRTARQGKRGTGTMILNGHDLAGYSTTATLTTKSMKRHRDLIESEQLRHFQTVELQSIQVKDKLFDVFCAFLNNTVRKEIRRQQDTYWNRAKSLVVDTAPTAYECSVIAAVEERWSAFLSKLDEREIEHQDAETECRKLLEGLGREFADGSIIKNPYHYIAIANDLLGSYSKAWVTMTKTGDVKRALGYFEKALKLEQKSAAQGKSDQVPSTDCPGSAHAGIAWCRILLQEEGYKDSALTSFASAMTCLSNEMSMLSATQVMLEQKQEGFTDSDLYKQLNVRATILGSYLSSIDESINAIRRSKRLINVVTTRRHKDGAPVKETIQHFVGMERQEEDRTRFKSENFRLSDEDSYTLTFNHLTKREDSKTIDQAVITLGNAFDSALLEEAKKEVSKFQAAKDMAKSKVFNSDKLSSLPGSRRNVRINLNQVDLSRVQSLLFNPDKESKDLTAESAVAQLKKERSYWHTLTSKLSTSLSADLTVHSIDDAILRQTHQDKQINELIGIIEGQMDCSKRAASLRYDIVVKKANVNQINQSTHTLTIAFDSLGEQAASDRLSSIEATSVDLEFVASKPDLLNVLATMTGDKAVTMEPRDSSSAKPSDSDGNIEDSRARETRKYEKVEIREAVKRVGELKTDATVCYVKFEALTPTQTEKIVKSCTGKQVLFGITFHGCRNKSNGGLGDHGQASLSFDQLGLEAAAAIIPTLREHNFDFALEFRDLSKSEVKFVLKYASLEQEDMKINKVKDVSELFTQSTSPVYELTEFALKGIEYLLQMSEKQFVPWRSVAIVALLGTCQVAVGGLLMVTGFGFGAGMGFVTEGIADLFTAYRAYSNRQFTWTDYCKQKAISLALAAMSAGYSRLKQGASDALKGVQTLGSGAAMQQAGQQVVSNANVVGQVLQTTGQNSYDLVAKTIGTKFAEAAVREGLNAGVRFLSSYSFSLLKPQISASVQQRVRASFCDTELMGYLRKFHALDQTTNTKQLKGRIDQIVAETVNPRNDFMTRQWESVGLPLLKGVLSDPNRCGSHAAMAIRIIGTLNGLKQVVTLTDNVSKALATKLRQVDRNSMTMGLVFQRHLKVGKDNATLIVCKLKQLEIFDDADNFNLSQSDLDGEAAEELKKNMNRLARDWKAYPGKVLEEASDSSVQADFGRCLEFTSKLHARFVAVELDAFDTIIMSVSEQIADQLIRVMDSQMLQPWSTLAVSKLTSAISVRVQNCLVNREQNSESLRADQAKYDELKRRGEAGEKLTDAEASFLTSFGRYRTFEQQATYNSKDYCESFSQCEIALYSTQEDGGGKPDEGVKQVANGVRAGGPANLASMLAVSKAHGVNLKVVDDPNYVRTKEDIENGVEVMYVRHGAGKDEVGHAYYMDKDGKFQEVPTTGYDCAFAAMGAILAGHGIVTTADELRAKTADHMEANSASFAKVIEAESYIRRTNPDAANSLLFVAGLYRDKDGNLIVEDKDVLKLLHAVKEQNQYRGGKVAKKLKNLLPTNDPDNPETHDTVHHVISCHEIKKAILAHGPSPDHTRLEDLSADERVKLENLRVVTQQLINNQAPLKAHMEEQMDYSQRLTTERHEKYEGLKEREERGEVLTYVDTFDKSDHLERNTGVYLDGVWQMNPNNLVWGPRQENRAENFNSSRDTEVESAQPEPYKEKVQEFYDAADAKQPTEQLRALATNQTSVNAAQWEKNPDTGKYKVTGAYPQQP